MGDAEVSATVRRRLTTRNLSGIETILAGTFNWTAGPTYDWADPPCELVHHVSEVLAEIGLVLEGAPVLVRHSSGQGGLPTFGTGASQRFAIDLTDGGTAAHGGALLFFESTGKGYGWKAELGALTLWQGKDPVLSEIRPNEPVRMTLIGEAS